MASVPRRRVTAPFGPPAFSDRVEAGLLLGATLRDLLGVFQSYDPERAVSDSRPAAVTDAASERAPAVFAIPRGGVAVGVGVARALNVPLDVLVVRKIGHPTAPELGLGAIAEDGAGGAYEPYFDVGMLGRVGLASDDLAAVVARERAELARRVSVYAPRREEGNAADLTGRLVIVVDDGLATGVTARAALRAVRARGAAQSVLAVPVAAPDSAAAMEKETGEVVTVVTPRRFRSVGEWYADFGQLTDDDVLTLLAAIP